MGCKAIGCCKGDVNHGRTIGFYQKVREKGYESISDYLYIQHRECRRSFRELSQELLCSVVYLQKIWRAIRGDSSFRISKIACHVDQQFKVSNSYSKVLVDYNVQCTPGVSPCKGCYRGLADKSFCSGNCKALDAYQNAFLNFDVFLQDISDVQTVRVKCNS